MISVLDDETICLFFILTIAILLLLLQLARAVFFRINGRITFTMKLFHHFLAPIITIRLILYIPLSNLLIAQFIEYISCIKMIKIMGEVLSLMMMYRVDFLRIVNIWENIFFHLIRDYLRMIIHGLLISFLELITIRWVRSCAWSFLIIWIFCQIWRVFIKNLNILIT